MEQPGRVKGEGPLRDIDESGNMRHCDRNNLEKASKDRRWSADGVFYLDLVAMCIYRNINGIPLI